MATVLNAGSGNKAQSLETWREARARSWDRLGKTKKPDHLQLCDREIAAGFRAGNFDPPAMPIRKFNLRTERYEG